MSNFDIHDIYQRAPFALIPPRIIKDIKTRLLFDDAVSRQIMHELLGWNYNDIVLYEKTGDRDPLQKMFDMMQNYEPECVITCADVNTHFRQRKCFPIIKVYSILKKLSPVYGFLEKEETIQEVIKEVTERRNNKDRYPDAREFKVEKNENDRFYDYKRKVTRFDWLKNFVSKKANVLVVNLSLIDSTALSSQSNINPTPVSELTKEEFNNLALKNLLENLTRNFNSVVTPNHLTTESKEFIDGQFSKATFLVIIMAESFIFNNQISLNSAPQQTNEHHRYLWSKATESGLPQIGVVFNETLIEGAEKIIIPVFLLPKEMDFLLNYVVEF